MLRAPHPKSPGLAAEVTEEMINRLVHTFYAKVRRDEILGPIFNRRVGNWEEHLNKLCLFWSSVALMTGSYKGRPVEVHSRISDVSSPHFDRWLALFDETAREVCPPQAALLFIDRAVRIAESLKLGIAIDRGESVVPELARKSSDSACGER